MKKLLLLTVGIMVGLVGLVNADWGKAFDITFTPTGARGVMIATTTVALGSMSLGTATTTYAIPVISTGSIASIEYNISGTVSGGSALTPHLVSNTTPAIGEVQVKAIFNTNALMTWAPWMDNVDSTPRGVGNVTQDGSFIGDYASGNQMDSMGLNISRNLYVSVILPAVASYSGLQDITITVTARAGD